MNQVVVNNGMSVEEKRALVATLLRQKSELARSASSPIHRRIEARAAQTPTAVALTTGETTLQYAELNARANRLARCLKSLGVGPDVLVGLCVSRSADMLVGILAILKSGGAYVPLDPSYPAERIAFMLDDAQAPVLLTEQKLRGDLPAGQARVLCVDSDKATFERESDANLDAGPDMANLAYVIYTSGSTGKPKGVQVSHGAIANLIESMRQLLAFSDRDALLAVTTLSFDIAALEIFLPLVAGARIDLIDREMAADGARLIDRLSASGITFLQATPATWRLLLEAGWQGKPDLTMLCGGEALPRALANRLIGKGRALWNVYGPTETTVWSSAGKVDAGESGISIGAPVANTRLYVLDQHLRVVPVGVVGELFIGGAGLARGYRNRAGLTAERFIPDPFAVAGDGGRLYRTGDLARWRPDGSLECLGRVDHQVKVRGFRIELGEIESALALHDLVRETAVAARPDASGELSLVAYVALRGQTDLKLAPELRKWLRERIPEYMVPGAFVFLDGIPLTPNGKVDRQALPDPAPVHSTQALSVPPRGPIEEALADLWKDLLGGDPPGAYDNFFERGGHSLLAVRLLSRLRQMFGAEVALPDFLEDPTIARLGRLITQSLETGTTGMAPPLMPVDRSGPLPLSFAQQRLWFLDQLEPGLATYHLPAAVRLTGRVDLNALERALNDVVRRHESLRTTFAADSGVPRQVIAEAIDIRLRVELVTDVLPEEREATALRKMREEVVRPFDLATGPLVRATVIKVADEDHIAIVVMHHAVSDGWSISILIREISLLYDAYVGGRPSPLAELPVQYPDFAAWHRSWLDGEVLEAELRFWKQQLAGVPNLELPTDRPRPPVASQRGGIRTASLPRPLVDAMRGLARSEGVTLYMALMAAFQVLLGRYARQDDFAVGTPIAGRSRPELEGLIGFFVNTLVIRADLTGDPGFREVLRRVKRTAIDAFAHQEMPFDRLVSTVEGKRDASRAPIFQTMFALQNVPPAPLHAPDLVLAPMEIPSESSMFDLTLYATEEVDGLRLVMEYSTDLFDADRIDRMLAHFRILIEEIVAHPEQAIGSLKMLTDDERAQVLAGWSNASNGSLRAALASADADDVADDWLNELSLMEVGTDE